MSILSILTDCGRAAHFSACLPQFFYASTGACLKIRSVSSKFSDAFWWRGGEYHKLAQ
ncbi:hypothetical protein [Paenibacillus montaniterrae]|uniref:hypothetical protein n=1 Tax=Paenibacillus montaniterrae TaxID=429341 RepID=UPI001BCF143A|nr:hypothetical protein [Paenibacillus montaniterrae]